MLANPWFTPYFTGFQALWTSTTSITIAPGVATADNNPNAVQGLQLINVGVDPLLDCTHAGLNGVQGGALVASTKYDVYAIGDYTEQNINGVYAVASGDTISLPTGYQLKRRILTFRTDGGAHILKFYQTGNSTDRQFTYDVPITVINAGTSTTYATVALDNYIPSLELALQVVLQGTFTPSVAGDMATLAQGDSTATNGQVQISGSVAAVPQIAQVTLPTDIDNNIQYKVAASGSLTATLIGYIDQL